MEKSPAKKSARKTPEHGPAAVQLPLWQERVRALPNMLARSALFNIGLASKRRHFHNEIIASSEDTTIRYRGEELRQRDQDVFLQIVHLARGKDPSAGVSFSAYGMLKELGWGDSAVAYNRLRDSIDRLKVNSLKIEFNLEGRQVGFSGSLIRKVSWDEQGASQGKARTMWTVWLEREIVVLFAQNTYSELEWAMRTRLRTEMAKWLMSYIVVSNRDHPIAVPQVKELSGSQSGSMTSFRQQLRKAFKELEEVGFCAAKVERDFIYLASRPGEMINRVRPAVEARKKNEGTAMA